MKSTLIVAVCAVALTATVSLAGFADPEDAIRYRQAVMTVIAQQFGQIAAVVKGKAPDDRNAVEHDAMVIRTLAQLPWDAMLTPGSFKGKSTLKPAVMDEKDKFMAIAHDFERDTQKLVETATSGDAAALRSQFGVVAGHCKTCHSDFRKR